MDLICFAPTNKYFSHLTSKVLEGLLKDDQHKTYKTFGSFLERITNPKKIPTILIFCAKNKRDFKKLLLYANFLINTEIILVLPDRKKETIDAALLLYPRFFISADQDFKEINDVVKKMRQKFTARKTLNK